jgi:CubicO group peptidase (beta-lactamase class C family)
MGYKIFHLMARFILFIMTISTLVAIDVDSIRKEFNVPGMVVGVIQDDQILLNESFGLRNENEPVNENTLFAIGSCSKAFTAYIISQLSEEHLIDLDDPVIKYLPHFYNPDLTITDLIAHRTGMARHDALWINKPLIKNDIVSLLKHLEPASEPHTTFQYNNLMYFAAGQIIEKVTGKSWEENVVERIFVPLNMTSSTVYPDQFLNGLNSSKGFAEIDNENQVLPPFDIDAIKPGGGVYSNLEDLLKWVAFQFNSNPTHDLKISFPPTQADDRQLGYGLGWFIGNYFGHDYIRHGGMMPGFTSEIIIFPSEKLGLVLLTNSSSEGSFAIFEAKNRLLEDTFNLTGNNWTAQAKASHDQAQLQLKATFEEKPCNLAPYIGEYHHPAYGSLSISKNGERLHCTHGLLDTDLYYIGLDRFIGRYELLLQYKVRPYFEFMFSPDKSELLIPFEGFRLMKPIPFKRKEG